MSKEKKYNSPTKGLSKYGYKISDDSEKRRTALRKAVVIFGPVKLIKALNSIRSENKSSELSIKACRDKKWIKDNYKKNIKEKEQIKSKRKKSKRSKRSKRKK